MNIRKAISWLLCVASLLFVLSACDIPQKDEDIKEPETQARSFYEYFDTVCVVMSYKGDSAEDFDANCNDIEELLEGISRCYRKVFSVRRGW
jgi:hypothetical protein